MNATVLKFGYPETLLHEYEHWVVLLRPEQVTLGSMVLASKSEAGAMSQLDVAAFTELSQVTRDLERALRNVFNHDKINYLLLMMVDKHVHFHVLPRYAAARELAGSSFEDVSWPGPPDLSKTIKLSDQQRQALLASLKSSWGL
jgi:diadenosine tetraphosphate (Ap4A) HIT family hydrolase